VLNEQIFLGICLLVIGFIAVGRIFYCRKTGASGHAAPAEGPELTEIGVESEQGSGFRGSMGKGILNHVDLLVVALIYGFLLILWVGTYVVDLKGVGEEKDFKLTGDLVATAAMSQLFFLLLPLIMVSGRQSPIEFFGLKKRLGLRWLGMILGAYLLIFLVNIMLSVAGYADLVGSLFETSEQQDLVKHLQGAESTGMDYFFAFFLAVVLAPICEEFLYRGYLNPVIEKYGGKHFAIILVGFLFAVVHGGVYPLLPLFFFGMILGYLYDATKSLWAPIICHALFNGSSVVASYVVKISNLS